MLTIDIGKALTLTVDPAALGFRLSPDVGPEQSAVLGHLLYIGLKNTLQDAHSSVKSGDYPETDEGRKAYRDDSLALAQKKLDALLAGVLRVRSAGPRASSVDPIMKESLREARVKIGELSAGKLREPYVAKLRVALAMPDAAEKDVLAEAVRRRAAKPENMEAARARLGNVVAIDEGELF